MNTKKYERKTKQFKKQAVERMQSCANISALSRELGVARRALYTWKAELTGSQPEPEQKLRREIADLQRALGEQALQISFFEGALRRIEERRSPSPTSGATLSTPRSKK
jgi:transposase-like protein